MKLQFLSLNYILFSLEISFFELIKTSQGISLDIELTISKDSFIAIIPQYIN